MTDVAVRLDCDAEIGTGHAIRCLTLASELRKRGARITFVCGPCPPSIQERIEGEGHGFQELPPTNKPRSPLGSWPVHRQLRDADATLALLAGEGVDAVIVDHYGLNHVWEKRLRLGASTIVAIDDLADRSHDVDVLVDTTWVGTHTASRYDGLIPQHALRLLGPRYALLQDRYRKLRAAPLEASETDRLVVSFGGTDPTGETEKVLRALAVNKFRDIVADVIIGGAVRDRRSLLDSALALPNVEVHEDLPSLAELFAGSRAAIGAAGATTWERICLGVASVVTTVAKNQVETAQALHEAGAVWWVGGAENTDTQVYTEAIDSAITGRIAPPPPLVDGWGAARVAAALVPLAHETVYVRRAQADDEPIFIGPDRGLPDLSPYLDGPPAWEQGLGQLAAALDGRTEAWVIELGGTPVGAALRSGASLRWWVHDAVRSTVPNETVPTLLAELP